MKSRTWYWIMVALGVALVVIGTMIAASVFTLIHEIGQDPAVTPDGQASLKFMTRTTGAVMAVFLGALLLAGAIVVAIGRRWLSWASARLEARFSLKTREILKLLKVSNAHTDALITAADAAADARHTEIMNEHTFWRARKLDQAQLAKEMDDLNKILNRARFAVDHVPAYVDKRVDALSSKIDQVSKDVGVLQELILIVVGPIVAKQLDEQMLADYERGRDREMDETTAAVRQELDEWNAKVSEAAQRGESLTSLQLANVLPMVHPKVRAALESIQQKIHGDQDGDPDPPGN